jgi:hypothetical protein
MQTMAAEVGVPAEDLPKSRAFPGFEHGVAVPGVIRLIHIHSGKSMSPDAFVRIRQFAGTSRSHLERRRHEPGRSTLEG